MSAFKPGDRIRDAKWDGSFTGTVNRVFADGDLGVQWDGSFVEDQIAPYEVQPEPRDREE